MSAEIVVTAIVVFSFMSIGLLAFEAASRNQREVEHRELAECHAANPGFDCRRGYVKGEPFNATP